jgi:hypothetical protein
VRSPAVVGEFDVRAGIEECSHDVDVAVAVAAAQISGLPFVVCQALRRGR